MPVIAFASDHQWQVDSGISGHGIHFSNSVATIDDGENAIGFKIGLERKFSDNYSLGINYMRGTNAITQAFSGLFCITFNNGQTCDEVDVDTSRISLLGSKTFQIWRRLHIKPSIGVAYQDVEMDIRYSDGSSVKGIGIKNQFGAEAKLDLMIKGERMGVGWEYGYFKSADMRSSGGAITFKYAF
ncbi:hypothetical protein DC094_07870 [Pelagibaculum spongiae]|uniref:Outer membrane protein beta-barrel domain-containing protein n=2 Tax=Pelagibaculum spongiae TaxID=2080658 RepID=A0A2V1GWV7_9GAMM|nr:hypothetical protein DC094_07870 [Pelagibaculum spongiae]